MNQSATPAPVPAADTVLEVEDLHVAFGSRKERVSVVNGVDFSLKRGEVLGVLGESGSGKSVMLRSLMGLFPRRTEYRGQIRLLGRQITEAIRAHEGLSETEARARALELFERVAIPSAKSRLSNYPHEMSGGMRQRVMIALALACRPKVLLADEPTTALDVTVQIQILLLLRELQREMDMAVIFVTHDIGVAQEVSDRIGVMYAGRFVEMAPTRDIIRSPRHPYTHGLLAATIHGQRRGDHIQTIPGAPPNLAHLPEGCAFAERCARAAPACRAAMPALAPLSPGHAVRCRDPEAETSAGQPR